MANGGDHGKLYDRTNVLEQKVAGMEPQIEYIQHGVDRIEEKLVSNQRWIIGVLVSFIVTAVFMFAKFMVDQIGGTG